MSRNFSGNNKVSNFQERQRRESPTHEAILGGLSKKEVQVTFVTTGNAIYRGRITQFDKFTITLMTEDGARVTLFKGSLESFSVES